MDASTVLGNVASIAARFATERHDRQRRRELDPGDFAALTEAGFHLTGVPVEAGGLFESVKTSTRPVAEILRTLAHGDASVALVASMHPAVMSFWLATADAASPYGELWRAQRSQFAGLAKSGSFFGTITSEPGSGGDVSRTKAAAEPSDDGHWLISGQKHFGSGSGVTSFMLTSARPDGEDEPEWFMLDMRDVPWDGSRGVTLIAPWDGHGMTATQSHGMSFSDFPAIRAAWPGQWRAIADAAGPFVSSLFTAVIVGVVESAMEAMSAQLAPKKETLRPYEQVEWVNAERDAWLLRQAYEGMLRAVETEPLPLRTVVMGKTAAAGLAEDCMRRIVRIAGGGSFARHSPLGFWFEDVRALGFLRPPWPLAYDSLFASSWSEDDASFVR